MKGELIKEKVKSYQLMLLLICLLAMLLIAGCGFGGKGGSAGSSQSGEAGGTELPASAEAVDVDLTELSSTMVYGEVYNMMTEPKQYLGKKIRMQGDFYVFHDEADDEYYFACIIEDATACCAQGIEFQMGGEYKFPDDFPEEGEEICVVGTFDYNGDENGSYYILRDAKLQ
ncbi:MAG: hypothetical protein IKE52_02010 [Mogibacterium sp.]|nr:hypothetical protein [Mogibacterium sp.]